MCVKLFINYLELGADFMEEKFNEIAQYILEKLESDTLDDGDVYEFTEQGSRLLEEGQELKWAGTISELWNYLQEERNVLNNNERDNEKAFRIGRIYCVMELIKMTQMHQNSSRVLQEDARYYGFSRKRKVFYALKEGTSLTHRELAAKSGLTDSQLSQFMHAIRDKNYIQFRKVGRTKYYRLSNVGKKLLSYMDNYNAKRMPLPNTLKNNYNKFIGTYEWNYEWDSDERRIKYNNDIFQTK